MSQLTAWIWGGSKGLGRAVAERLISEDWRVTCLSRTRPDYSVDWVEFDVDQNGEAIEHLTHRLILGAGLGYEGDELNWFIQDSDEWFTMLKRWQLERLGAPDLALLSAGIGAYMMYNEWHNDWWEDKAGKQRAGVDTVMRINAMSKVWIAKEIIRAMRRSRRGKLLLVGSRMAERGDRSADAYAMSQAALRGFLYSAWKLPARRGVTVALIEPGLAKTAMTAGMPAAKLEAYEARYGKMITPEFFADAVIDNLETIKPGDILAVETPN